MGTSPICYIRVRVKFDIQVLFEIRRKMLQMSHTLATDTLNIRIQFGTCILTISQNNLVGEKVSSYFNAKVKQVFFIF